MFCRFAPNRSSNSFAALVVDAPVATGSARQPASPISRWFFSPMEQKIPALIERSQA